MFCVFQYTGPIYKNAKRIGNIEHKVQKQPYRQVAFFVQMFIVKNMRINLLRTHCSCH